MIELREKVERLRMIKECENEIDWWSHTLSQRQQVEALQEIHDSLPSSHQADGRHVEGRGEWSQVLPRKGK